MGGCGPTVWCDVDMARLSRVRGGLVGMCDGYIRE